MSLTSNGCVFSIKVSIFSKSWTDFLDRLPECVMMIMMINELVSTMYMMGKMMINLNDRLLYMMIRGLVKEFRDAKRKLRPIYLERESDIVGH